MSLNPDPGTAHYGPSADLNPPGVLDIKKSKPVKDSRGASLIILPRPGLKNAAVKSRTAPGEFPGVPTCFLSLVTLLSLDTKTERRERRDWINQLR